MQYDGLPPEYQRVDYLKNTGTIAHIDTGVGNGPNLKIEYTFLAENYVQYAAMIGNFTSGQKGWRVIINTTLSLLINAYSGSYSTLAPAGGTITNSKITVVFDTQKSKAIDGTGTVEKTAAEITGSDRVANIALGRNGVSPGATGTGTVIFRFYDCRIWDNSKLIRNYVPCYRKSDNKAGFYDTVNHTFNPSIGSVDFVAGYDE